jgi:hypothetical protein
VGRLVCFHIHIRRKRLFPGMFLTECDEKLT